MATQQGLEELDEGFHGFSTLSERIQTSIFSVFHVMGEKREYSFSTRLWNSLLLFTDWLQMLSLTWSPLFGWPNDLPLQFSIMDIILGLERSTALFYCGYVVALLICWISLLDAVYVGHAFGTNNHQYLWPVQLLRGIVTLTVTAGFVPLIQLLMLTFDCREMQSWFSDRADAFQCSSSEGIFLMVTSSLSIAVFLPFALTAALLVLHDLDPTSTSLLAKPTGRDTMLDTLVRVLLVMVVAWIAPAAPLLGGAILFLVMILLVAVESISLPNYRMRFTSYRGLQYSLLAWNCLGGLTLLLCTDAASPARRTAALVLLGLSPLVGAAGYFLPHLRRRTLQQRALELLRHLSSEQGEGEDGCGGVGKSLSVARRVLVHVGKETGGACWGPQEGGRSFVLLTLILRCLCAQTIASAHSSRWRPTWR